MKQKLSDVFVQCKGVITIAMEEELNKAGKDKVEFTPFIRTEGSRDADELFIDFTGLELDKDDNIWYAHNFVTCTDLSVDEYWTPLRDLSFEELFKISEKL